MEPVRRRRRRRREGSRVLAATAALAAICLLGVSAGCAAVAGHGTVAAGVTPAARATAAAPPRAAAPTTITQTHTYTATATPEAEDPGPDSAADSSTDTATDSDLYRDTAAAVTFTEGFWNDTFNGWDVTWHGPSQWAGNGFYDSALRDLPGAEWWTEGPTCAGERAHEDNAGFCSSGVVAWDHALMEPMYETYGHSFVSVVVAHEWAHAAQQRFIEDGEAPAVLEQQELQADCLAGTTIAGAVKLGYLELEIGDTDRLTATLEAMGDETSRRSSDDHGSSQERVSWFTTGFNDGIEACLGNA